MPTPIRIWIAPVASRSSTTASSKTCPHLRQRLAGTPVFASETDSEIIAHLLGEAVAGGASIVDALRAVFPLLEGQNAVIAIDQQEEVIAAAMNVSPLVIGTGPTGSFISSDPFALIGKATEMVIAPNEAVIQLGPDGVVAFAYDGRELPMPDAHQVPDLAPDELGPYSHFMAKEMDEQPAILRWQVDDHSIRRAPRGPYPAGRTCRANRLRFRLLCRAARGDLAHRAGQRPGPRCPASEFGEIVPFLNPKRW